MIHLTIRVLPVVALMLAALPPAVAQSISDDVSDGEMRALTREMQTLFFLKKLELNDDQARRILPMVRGAAGLRAGYMEAAAARRVEMEKAIRALLSEDEKGQGPNPEVRKTAIRARNGYKKLGEEFREALERLAARVLETLSPGQAKIAREFRPPVPDDGRILPSPEHPGSPGDKGSGTGAEEKLLRGIRSLPGGAWDSVEERMVDLQVEREEARRGEKLSETDRKDRTGEIRAFFHAVRAMDGDAFESGLKTLCREVKPRTLLEDLQDSLEDLADGRDPAAGPIEKYLLNEWAAASLEARVGK